MSERDEWRTPAWFIAHVRAVLPDGIDLDPFSSADGNINVQARRYFTSEYSAFDNQWRCNTLYMNPPYSTALCRRALSRFLDAWQSRVIAHSAIVLVNAIHDTKYGGELVGEADAICLPGKRIQFDPPPGVKKSSNRFNQLIAYFGPDQTTFNDVFGGHVGPVFYNAA